MHTLVKSVDVGEELANDGCFFEINVAGSHAALYGHRAAVAFGDVTATSDVRRAESERIVWIDRHRIRETVLHEVGLPGERAIT